MGNHNQKSQQQTLLPYSEIQKQQHPFIGSITHLIHRQLNTKHILKLSKYATQQELNQALKRAKKRKQLSKKKGSVNILRTTEILHDQNNQLCGITYYLYHIMQDFSISLSQLIKAKSQQTSQQRYFAQQQIFQLLRNTSQAIIFLNDNNFKNYTICKQSIFKSIKDKNNQSCYKVLDTEIAKQMLPYIKILNNIPIEKGIYFAPQIMEEMKKKNSDPDVFGVKADVFCLGMIGLEMGILEGLDGFYDFEKGKINLNGIYQKLDKMGQSGRYSAYLRGLLRQMLQANQEQRIGVVTLRQKLSLSDNKSTTDYGHSLFGNSNVTQRTHKLSYPNVNYGNRNGSADQNGLQLPYQQVQNQRIPRVLTVENIAYQNQNQNQVQQQVYQQVQPQYVQFQEGRKNQTFDNTGNKYLLEDKIDEKGRNRSTDKIKATQEIEEQRKRVVTTNNYPFYYPPHIKPASVPSNFPPIQHHPLHPHPHYTPIFQQSPYYLPQHQPMHTPPNQKLQQTLPVSTVPVSRPPQIKIPQTFPVISFEKSQPQTPINDLKGSNAFLISDPLSLRPRSSSNSQDYTVLNSFQVGFKKAQSKQESYTPILQNKIQCDSPERPPKNNSTYPASNESTPIRKVQALQSHNRSIYNQQIIKQTQQQQNQPDTLPLILPLPQTQSHVHPIPYNHPGFQNSFVPSQKVYTGPKTYGKHHFTSGAVYEGQFDSTGNFCGNGVLYYPNGKICYSGGWIDNAFHGFGVLNNQAASNKQAQNKFKTTNYENFNLNDSNSWHHYEGQFCMDKKNGFGTLYMCNGDKFSGCFVKDLIQGYGTFTNRNGQRISGIWNQNVLKKF